MNPRIQELAQQAGLLPRTIGPAVETRHMKKKQQDLEKFAELIVRACMQQVEEQYRPVMEDPIMRKDPHWDGYVQCGVDSFVAIREHFFGEEE